jgi:VanZ family protein
LAYTLLVVYGISTESLQLFVPHRTARVVDAIENILGIVAGAGIYWLAQIFRKPDRAARLVKHASGADVTVE